MKKHIDDFLLFIKTYKSLYKEGDKLVVDGTWCLLFSFLLVDIATLLKSSAATSLLKLFLLVSAFNVISISLSIVVIYITFKIAAWMEWRL